MHGIHSLTALAARIAQATAVALLAALATGALAWTLAAALGLAPWLRLGGAPVVLPGGVPVEAGILVQIALTALLLAVASVLRPCLRVLALEAAHRDFTISMADVARAYAAVFSADRAGLFDAEREFDAMRERLAHLRNHPALSTLEPALLEVAAQMSIESRDLAQTFSRERVSRARLFLAQRAEEARRQAARIAEAEDTCRELRAMLDSAGGVEAGNAERLVALRRELDTLLRRIDRAGAPPAGPERVARLHGAARPAGG